MGPFLDRYLTFWDIEISKHTLVILSVPYLSDSPKESPSLGVFWLFFAENGKMIMQGA
jgi:hypothetical protein